MTPKLPSIDFAADELKLEGASTVKQEQFIARPRAEVFQFFSEPRNLERLTPPWLNFEIVEIPEQLSEGALIRYKLRLHGLTIHWTTRIEQWTPDEKFVDTQISGPYSMWHHTHEFEEVEGGTLVRDLVRYRVPFGPLGEVIRRAMVAPDTKKIFEFRREMLEAEFS
jgi:ligand-binding SRPBCC domain-containing protein